MVGMSIAIVLFLIIFIIYFIDKLAKDIRWMNDDIEDLERRVSELEKEKRSSRPFDLD